MHILPVPGVPALYLMAWLTMLVEVFAGLAIVLGALVARQVARWGHR